MGEKPSSCDICDQGNYEQVSLPNIKSKNELSISSMNRLVFHILILFSQINQIICSKKNVIKCIGKLCKCFEYSNILNVLGLCFISK